MKFKALNPVAVLLLGLTLGACQGEKVNDNQLPPGSPTGSLGVAVRLSGPGEADVTTVKVSIASSDATAAAIAPLVLTAGTDQTYTGTFVQLPASVNGAPTYNLTAEATDARDAVIFRGTATGAMVADLVTGTVVIVADSTRPNVPGFQGFETDTAGWTATQGITRVASGTGVPASAGEYYAVLQNKADEYDVGYGDAGYSFFGGKGTEYKGDFYQSIDVYVDASWAPGTNPGVPGFWIDMTPYHADPANYGAEHNFQLTATGSQVDVRVDGQATPIASITASGWYTFQMTFQKSVVAADEPVITQMQVLDAQHASLGWAEVNATSPGGPFASKDLLGNGYVWITVWQNGFANDTLAIDNVKTGLLPPPQPRVITVSSTATPVANAAGVAGDGAPGFEAGSIKATIPNPNTSGLKAEMYFGTSSLFGHPVKLGDIARISYWTKKSTAHVNPDVTDWYINIYTMPYAGQTSGWYGARIGAEPYLAANLVETVGAWNLWSTDGQTNQLRFFESTNGYFGSYTDPSWSDFVTGYSLTGTHTAVAVPYASQEIKSFSVQTASAAAGLDAQLDGVRIELKDGSVAVLDMQP